MNLFNRLWGPPPEKLAARRLYAAIVAQTRLAPFYAGMGVPDTLEGRFVVLILHHFALLHRLRREGEEALPLAQELVDLFSQDMDAVYRELGVSDLKVPKKVRRICAEGHGLVNRFEAASGDPAALRSAIAESLPVEEAGEAEAASAALTAYLTAVMAGLAAQPFAALTSGDIRFQDPQAYVEIS